VCRTERIHKIDELLNDRKVVPFQGLLEALEVAPATLKRDLEHVRRRLNAPIVWDREARGNRFAEVKAHGPRYQLPGLWFNASEIHIKVNTKSPSIPLLALPDVLCFRGPGFVD
jgi:predicted DNA-binding transcriptional regulator YafY